MDPALGQAELALDRAGVDEQSVAGRGQPQCSALAQDDRGAERALEFGNAGRERRLRNMELCRSCGERTAVDER